MSTRQKKSDFYGVALFIVLVVVVAAVFQIRVASAESIPLPENIKIIPPSSDTAKEIAAFSGKWKGSWWSGRNQPRGEAILIIEKLEMAQQKAQVVYAWGPLVDPMYPLKEG